MLERITTFIEQHHLLPDRGRVIVAVSGGADSLCLLHLLCRLCGPGKRYPAVQLHVAHLNHQLRGEAGSQDADAVAGIAASWGLPITIGTVDVPALARDERRSLEEAARVARYRFLREVAHGDIIAVAHHQDDQVETLLLHWLRGGGLGSMAGLQPRQHDIIRPLLAVTHVDTVAYCQRYQLVPLEDVSNVDPRFLRNRIRHELVPLLESLNPGIRETLLRNAEVMRVDYKWIEAQVARHWSGVVIAQQRDEQYRLSIPTLRELPLSLQRHLVRQVTARLCAGQSPLELRHYRLIEQLFQRADDDEGRKYSQKTTPLDLPQRLRVVRQGDTLVFEQVRDREQRHPSMSENTEVSLSIPGSVIVPGTPWIAQAEEVAEEVTDRVRRALRRADWAEVWHILPATSYAVYIDADRLRGDEPGAQETLRVRTRRAGDQMRPLGMAHRKKVQDVLVDKHIPYAERDQIPLFFAAAHCVWLAGVQLDDRVRLSQETRRIIRLSIVPATR